MFFFWGGIVYALQLFAKCNLPRTTQMHLKLLYFSQLSSEEKISYNYLCIWDGIVVTNPWGL